MTLSIKSSGLRHILPRRDVYSQMGVGSFMIVESMTGQKKLRIERGYKARTENEEGRR